METFPNTAIPVSPLSPLRRFKGFQKNWRKSRRGANEPESPGCDSPIAYVSSGEDEAGFPSSSSRASVATDDFHSAFDEQEFPPSLTLLGSVSDEEDAAIDKLTFAQVAYLDTETDDSPSFHDTKQEAASDHGVFPAEKTYDAVKGVWGWGKGLMIVSPFLRIAEGIASKAVALAGSSLEDVDSTVMDSLHALDDRLNPAIATLVDFVKPIVMAFLKPLGITPESA
jgi:hypothetical protein